MTGTPRASASTTRHGNAARRDGATKRERRAEHRRAVVRRRAAPRTCSAPLRDAGRRGEVGDRRLVALLRVDAPRRAGRCRERRSRRGRHPGRRSAPARREQHEPLRQVERAAAADLVGRARRSPSGAAPAITRIRSPSGAISARRAAIACVGTTTASAYFTARLSIARCHATAARGSSSGASHGRRSQTVTTVWSLSCTRSWRTSGANSVGEWIMPPPIPVPTPSCSAAGELAPRQRGAAHAGETRHGRRGRPRRRRARSPRPRSPAGAPITSARASSRDASARSGSVGATSWSSTTRASPSWLRAYPALRHGVTEVGWVSAGAAPAGRAPARTRSPARTRRSPPLGRELDRRAPAAPSPSARGRRGTG